MSLRPLASMQSNPYVPFFYLPVFYWESRTTVEKDEDFQVVLDEFGEPKVDMAWVEIYLVAPDGHIVKVEMEQDAFSKYAGPGLLQSSIKFWQTMRLGDPLFSKRGEALSKLRALL